jgi:hypothetical protein
VLSLPARNEKAMFRMSHCTPRRSHCYRAIFILKVSCDRRTIVSQIPAMTPGSVSKKQKMEKYHAQ